MKMHVQLRGSLSYEQTVQSTHRSQEIQSKGNPCVLTFTRESFLEKSFRENNGHESTDSM